MERAQPQVFKYLLSYRMAFFGILANLYRIGLRWAPQVTPEDSERGRPDKKVPVILA